MLTNDFDVRGLVGPGRRRSASSGPGVCAMELDSMLALYQYAAESIAAYGDMALNRRGVPVVLDSAQYRERQAPPVTVSTGHVPSRRHAESALQLVRFDYAPVNGSWAVVRLLAGPGEEPCPVAWETRHHDSEAGRLFGLLEADPAQRARWRKTWWPQRTAPINQLWRVSFAIPVEVVEISALLFALTPMDRLALALPKQDPRLLGASAEDLVAAYVPGRQARRRLVALATTFAVSGVSPLALSVATAQAADPGAGTGSSSGHPAATAVFFGSSVPKLASATRRSKASTPAPRATATPKHAASSSTPAPRAPAIPTHTAQPHKVTAAPAPRPAAGSGTLDTLAQACAVTSATPVGHSSPPPAHATALAAAPRAKRARCQATTPTRTHHKLKRLHAQLPGKLHVHTAPAATKPSASSLDALGPTCSAQTSTGASARFACPAPITSAPVPHAPAAATHHRHTSKHAVKRQAPKAAPVVATPAPISAFVPGAHPAVALAWSRLSTLLARGDKPPAFLIPIYKAAGHRYHVPWPVLAAINAIETDYGRDLNTSPKGAMGWMQFMPGTWDEYGVVAGNHALPDPYDPRDAIFSAARYLAASGARHNLRKAIFAYNHATWYVDEVLWTAASIADQMPARGSRARIGLDAMKVMARGLEGEPYLWGGGHAGWDIVGGYDCSGFVSAVLHAAGYLGAPVTTQALPLQPDILAGPGRYVTIFDRTDGGALDEDHVIIDLNGQWWESGGSGAVSGVHRITSISASYLLTFNQILHPRGL